MKKVFITGAAGFIGFHLAKKLLEQGVQVVGIDNFNSYYSPELKKDRAGILKELGCTVKNVDLTDFELLKKTFDDFDPTHVVHLAAQAGVRYSLQNPNAYVQSNLVGFTHLLEILKERPEILTLYASSSSVYGDNQKVPYSESDITDQPKNLYGATKKANELMAYSYHSLYGLRILGMRFFTVYGPWGRPDMAYYLFSKAILEKKPIQVFEGKSIQRDFTYIDDTISGILAALDSDFSYEVFNFGNNKPVLLNDFISTLEQALGSQAIKDYKPQAKGDMRVTYADIDKSQKLLGYNPVVNLKDGLTEFARWFVPRHQKLDQEKKQKLPTSK